MSSGDLTQKNEAENNHTSSDNVDQSTEQDSKDLKDVHYSLDARYILDSLMQDTFIQDDAQEDIDLLDYSYLKLLNDMQQKFNLLQSISQQNEAMEDLLNGVTSNPSQGVALNKDQQKKDALQEMVDARREELLELVDQQVEDLDQFEDDVRVIAEKFPKDSTDNETKSLMDKVDQLQSNIQRKKEELMEYKEELTVSSSPKPIEESIILINSLNEKLTRSVEQMTKDINRVRSEVSSFSVVRATASSMIMSIVASREHI